jgi:UDP:flavonoid glycosyltransferase YjiC (YdhE family)
MDALANGSPVYSADTLAGYVEEDQRLMAAVRPDVVVGDFRISLGVSAELSGIPYVTVTNAYWSPYAEPRYVVPDLPFVRVLGAGLGQVVFDAVRPFAFAHHTRPLARVRRRYGLPDLGFDLRRTYTTADVTLYADIPELIALRGMPANHHFIGPVHWQPEVAPPPWWSGLPGDRPIVYVTLGSSGPKRWLPGILEALGGLPVTVIAATAGPCELPPLPPNVHVAEYLPGDDAARRAAVVVCNGGAPTSMQALRHGVPVIAVPSNLDQYLNMHYLAAAGVGRIVRTGPSAGSAVRAALGEMLSDRAWSARAQQVAEKLAAHDYRRTFPGILAAAGKR